MNAISKPTVHEPARSAARSAAREPTKTWRRLHLVDQHDCGVDGRLATAELHFIIN